MILETEEKKDFLDAVAAEIATCSKCLLHTERKNTVPGVGNPNADVLIIGEAPGEEEDKQGLPFVGPAGEMLTKLCRSQLHTERDDIFITNTVKCRPPMNRNPGMNEIDKCGFYLHRQIAFINPKVIITLGKVATETVTEELLSITRVRGGWRHYEKYDERIPIMPTFHPSYVLRCRENGDLEPARQIISDFGKVFRAFLQ